MFLKKANSEKNHSQKRHANIDEKAKKTAKMVRAALISF